MPRTLSETVYTYDELSPAAQAKAREWYREASAGDQDYAECVIEDFQRIAEILGITLKTHAVQLRNGKTRAEPCIWWSGFGACFEGTYGAVTGMEAAIAAHAPQDTELARIAAELSAHPSAEATIRHTGHYYHARSTEIAVSDAAGDELPEADAEAVREALRDLMDWLYRQLEAEYEARQTDEYIAETLQANAYEFTAGGSRRITI